MKVLQITHDDVKRMSDYAEKMLYYGGRLMSAIEDMEGGSEMSERSHIEEMADNEPRMAKSGAYYRYR